jgi:intracellular sulfur oxidation DsrE/DsrF family protein
MRKVLFAILFAFIATSIDAQPKNDANTTHDSASAKSKFYFPSRLYNDSVALAEVLPKLAEQTIEVYKEEKKSTYFENLRNLYFFSNNFPKLSETIDSSQSVGGDITEGIDVKSYAVARLKEKSQHVSFEQAFRNEFNVAFNKLSFQKKVYFAQLDSNSINDLKKDYTEFKGQLQKKNSDSLELSDLLPLFDKYFRYSFYKNNYALMSPELSNPKYRPMFPAIKANQKWGGALPVDVIDEKPDPNLQYKLLFEITNFGMNDQDTSAKKDFNQGLTWVERQLNLHESSGIPRKNIHPVIVVHGDALDALLTNEKYKKKYGIDNPNIPLIKELQSYGANILVCGQAMTWGKLEKQDLLPGIKQALSAQTAITSYLVRGYFRR